MLIKFAEDYERSKGCNRMMMKMITIFFGCKRKLQQYGFFVLESARGAYSHNSVLTLEIAGETNSYWPLLDVH
jgi:hypothetical protein